MSAEPLLELAEHVLTHAGATDDPAQALVLADAAAEAANAQLLAAALDRAWGLAPTHPGLAPWRAQTLDGLELKEHGLIFRFVPPGTFLMGSVQGDLDEQPVHPVRTDGFWLTDVPVSWADYCRLLGWGPPPRAEPPVPRTREDFPLHFDPRICMQYCETETLRAVDWHAHAGMEHSGPVPRRHPESPDNYAQKPMVSVSWRGAEALAQKLSTRTVQYGLPTEAEWEKAARGGLIGKRYSWGDEPPDRQRCDSGHFGEFVIRPPRELAPNGYGLHAMCGCVWEWTTAPYDALAYHPRQPPTVFDPGLPRVARGGSFVDDEAAVTVSFRMALADRQVSTPTIGFRLVRRVGEFQIAAPAVVTKSSAPPPAPPPAPEAPAKPSWLSRIFGGKK